MKFKGTKSRGKKQGVIILLGLEVFVLVCSCKRQAYNYKNYRELRKPAIVTKLLSIPINSVEFFYPSTAVLLDDYFLLVDSKADKLIRILELPSMNLVNSFGGLGQGPSEFIGIRQLITDPANRKCFWVYDISTRNLKYFNIDKILKNEYLPEEVFRLSTEKSGLSAQLLALPNKTMISVGLFFAGRIAIYDLKGNFVRTIGKLPFVADDGQSVAQHSHGFLGNIAFKDRTEEIYVAVRLGSIIEKYNMEGVLLSTLQGPDTFYPEYSIVPAGQYQTMTYNKNTRYGYLDIKYNKKIGKLFLLYSGKYQNHKDPAKRGYLGNTIYVLNDRDEIEKQLELDKDIFQIVVSDDGRTLYGLSEKEVLKYELADDRHRDKY